MPRYKSKWWPFTAPPTSSATIKCNLCVPSQFPLLSMSGTSTKRTVPDGTTLRSDATEAIGTSGTPAEPFTLPLGSFLKNT